MHVRTSLSGAKLKDVMQRAQSNSYARIPWAVRWGSLSKLNTPPRYSGIYARQMDEIYNIAQRIVLHL